MKLSIDDFCIRCQLCETLYPDLFRLDVENDVIMTKVADVPENLMDDAKNAIKDCAVTAIRFTK
ncbi:MAG: ferredoxin [Desulfatitalea sp.]|nr:ferredoxin [Desulfatitalea sp.]NNK00748.1 ferredoxin [Desulfatitalea sp.]